jgi:glutamate formiminotransferase/formiminotetrahydrofolate cyclodeaminase
MKAPLIECVPNFSEGRRQEVLDQIRESISSVPGVYVLDIHTDPDHNRSVITFVGNPAAVEEAAFRMTQKASQLINLNKHSGEHPRIGATDVVPFVPISQISMEECVELAHRVGNRIGDQLGIPVYFYENAALRPERTRLEVIRRGEYEGLMEEISSNPERFPDCGPAHMGPAGATVVGAREFLIAYNVNLTTADEAIADKIARTIRHSSGGLRYLKALGMTVDGRAQVSMNLTNFRKTSLPLVVETIRREAERYGVGIHNSELVGLIPQEALVDTAVWYTQMDLFSPDQVLEQRLAAAAAQDGGADFIEALADGSPTPGGGSASAFAGAMAAGLVSMTARLTVGKKAYQEVSQAMEAILASAEELRVKLQKAVEEDAKAYQEVVAAYKRPPSDPDRGAAIQKALAYAAEIPLGVAGMCLQVLELAIRAAAKGNKNAISDAGTAANLAFAALTGASYNVRINLNSLEDQKRIKELSGKITGLEDTGRELIAQLKPIMTERGGV